MELIKISSEGGKQTVNARELHKHLESKQQFADWIKKRIDQYDFIEDQDFVTNHKKMNRQTLTEYHISLDMAKELSMVERNDKGREARKYFIECEKVSQNLLPTDPAAQALLLAQSVISLNKTIEQQQPAVEFTRAMSNVQDSVKVGDLAKMLYSDNIKIGQNRLFKWLYDNKYLKDSSTPYQKYMDLGLFEIVSGVIERSTTGKIWKTVKVTGKGIVYITQKLQECEEFKVKLKVK